MPLLEGVKFYWLDDGGLSYWTWMPSLEHVFFGMLPKLLNIADFYKGQHPLSDMFVKEIRLRAQASWFVIHSKFNTQ